MVRALLSSGATHMRLRSILWPGLALFAGLASAGTPHGRPLPAGATVPLAEAIAGFEAHAGRPQRFGGRIVEVCQARGCWLVLEDGGHVARVMAGDQDFAIPRDAAGSAVVHGVLARRELTPRQARHLAAESPAGMAVAPVEYRITADGIEIAP
jgi:hypothetical protein